MYTLERLIKSCDGVLAEINGKWVPARPLPFYGLVGFKMRFRDAMKVLTGKADAFTWPEGQ